MKNDKMCKTSAFMLIAIKCLLFTILGISIAVLILTISLTEANAASKRLTATKVINTEYGKVRGKLESTLFGDKHYYAFRGIPFAQPPIGDLRFKVR